VATHEVPSVFSILIYMTFTITTNAQYHRSLCAISDMTRHGGFQLEFHHFSSRIQWPGGQSELAQSKYATQSVLMPKFVNDQLFESGAINPFIIAFNHGERLLTQYWMRYVNHDGL
jgi:hypothetical protein